MAINIIRYNLSLALEVSLGGELWDLVFWDFDAFSQCLWWVRSQRASMVLSSYVSTKNLRGGLSHSFALRLTPLLLWLGLEEKAVGYAAGSQ